MVYKYYTLDPEICFLGLAFAEGSKDAYYSQGIVHSFWSAM